METHRLRIAVWLVIASEALLFAGLFALYTAYRTEYPHAFSAGIALDVQWIGGVNTLILLTSSFAIAWAVERNSNLAFAATLILGLAFLVLKLVEWSIHIHDGIVPGIAYYHGPDGGRGTILFFTLYYLMTGLHAAHVVAGLVLVAWVALRARRHARLIALYWHFVDVVWVFLWPLFYLMKS